MTITAYEPDLTNLLSACIELRENGPRFPQSGICENAGARYGVKYHAICGIFKRWPKFSGMICFPVPSENNVKDAETTYISVHISKGNMWNRDTQYGRDRWELLDFIIEELEKQLEETK